MYAGNHFQQTQSWPSRMGDSEQGPTDTFYWNGLKDTHSSMVWITPVRIQICSIMVKQLIRAVANSCTTEEFFKIPVLFNNIVERCCEGERGGKPGMEGTFLQFLSKV